MSSDASTALLFSLGIAESGCVSFHAKLRNLAVVDRLPLPGYLLYSFRERFGTLGRRHWKAPNLILLQIGEIGDCNVFAAVQIAGSAELAVHAAQCARP